MVAQIGGPMPSLHAGIRCSETVPARTTAYASDAPKRCRPELPPTLCKPINIAGIRFSAGSICYPPVRPSIAPGAGRTTAYAVKAYK